MHFNLVFRTNYRSYNIAKVSNFCGSEINVCIWAEKLHQLRLIILVTYCMQKCLHTRMLKTTLIVKLCKFWKYARNYLPKIVNT